MPKQSRPARDAVSGSTSQVIPIVEEHVVVLKRKTLTEGARVHKTVQEDEAAVDEPVASETVSVERVPLDRWVEGPVPVRQEGDTTVITLLEEVVVVEKRLRATEEVRITKRREVERHAETVTLRREEAVIERVSANGDDIPKDVNHEDHSTDDDSTDDHSCEPE